MHAMSDKIRVDGHKGTWYVIDVKNDLYLLEHETYGDTAPCIIVDCKGTLVMEDVYNGFDDLK